MQVLESTIFYDGGNAVRVPENDVQKYPIY